MGRKAKATGSTAGKKADLSARSADRQRRRRYGRWRALSLSLVYVLFAAHIIHWKVSGRTLAPLELNEVMYTLELGIVTAGFLFMCVLVLGTLFFGRFFCSWACHIMVLQELCAWMLRKLGIRRKPIRSRLLLFVPPLTALYMFIWPQIVRAWHSGAMPEFHFRTDAEGWASFVTENFWRNLPSAPIIVLTFLVCGFLIVYLMGSRTFCTYVCPYGAIFALADRVAPGRIQVKDKCRQCGTCTATCTSGIRVHEEVKANGVIVNPACMKCLDCVDVCPQNALRYGFTKPALFKSVRSGGRFGRLPYDFSLREETLMALVFLFVTFAFRGLYSRIPFLLSLTLGGIIAYLIVVALRLINRPNVLLATLTLRKGARLTPWGRAYAGFAAALVLFVFHSAFVRYHEYRGLKEALCLGHANAARENISTASSALGHLRMADQWGLLPNERVQRGMLDASLQLQRFDEAEAHARKLLEQRPADGMLRLKLGQSLAAQGHMAAAEAEFRTITRWNVKNPSAPHIVAAAHEASGGLLARQGRFAAATTEFRRALKLDPNRATTYAELGSALAEQGQLDESIECLREAVRRNPQLGQAHYNLGTLLAQTGRLQEAVHAFEQAAKIIPNDSDLYNNLGLVLLQSGNLERAREEFERAVRLDSGNANAHFNLGRLFASRQNVEQAVKHYRIAARLDVRYAQYLSD